MDQQSYRNLISGESVGLVPAGLRVLLKCAAVIYSFAIRLRNLLYCKNLLKSSKPDATVISIGNITAGGTGKTPLVIWLANKISQTHKPAILTRGYKMKPGEQLLDEPALLKKNCLNVPVIINPDRLGGARQALNKYHCDVLIADDGFQHRRLKRDIDIVAIDSKLPFGYGKMLPAGLLREPLCSLNRADAVVITRCSSKDRAKFEKIKNELLAINPNLIIAAADHKPIELITIDGEELSLNQLTNKKVFAFCGIGNPDAFFNSVKGLSAELVGTKIFNDHHRYSHLDIKEICENAVNLDSKIILTTEKDATKLGGLSAGELTKQAILAYVKIEIVFTFDEDKISELIKNTLEDKIR